MFNFKKRPYCLLLLTAVLLLVASFFVHNQTLDMHLHDTYFIISMPLLFWPMILLLLLFWILYLFTERFLSSKVLMWVHIILMVLASVSLVGILFYSNYQEEAGSPRQYYDFSNWESMAQFDGLARRIVVIFLAIFLGVIIYIINLFTGLIKRFRGRRNIR